MRDKFAQKVPSMRDKFAQKVPSMRDEFKCFYPSMSFFAHIYVFVMSIEKIAKATGISKEEIEMYYI